MSGNGANSRHSDSNLDLHADLNIKCEPEEITTEPPDSSTGCVGQGDHISTESAKLQKDSQTKSVKLKMDLQKSRQDNATESVKLKKEPEEDVDNSRDNCTETVKLKKEPQEFHIDTDQDEAMVYVKIEPVDCIVEDIEPVKIKQEPQEFTSDGNTNAGGYGLQSVFSITYEPDSVKKEPRDDENCGMYNILKTLDVLRRV
ncbi:hypothetical protein O0L34_g11972 [Tuta absoluta]|nr:hypothetical protein O0L34_g11972 [Tuta absoluta]